MTGDQNLDGEKHDAGEDIEALRAKMKEYEQKASKLEAARTEVETLKQRLENADRALLDPNYLAYLEKLKRGDNERSGDSEIDLDTLTGSQLAQHLSTSFEERLTRLKDDHKKELAQLTAEAGKALATLDLDLAKMKHEDLAKGWDDEKFRDDFYQVAKSNPTKRASEVFAEIRAKKLVQEQEERKREEAREQAALDAIGEKSGIPQSSATSKDLSDEEAANLAYRKAFGNKAEVGPELDED